MSAPILASCPDCGKARIIWIGNNRNPNPRCKSCTLRYRRLYGDLKEREVNTQSLCALAYVVGVSIGDGIVHHSKASDNYYCGLQVKDKVFATRFANSLAEIGYRPKIYRLHTRDRWQTSISSKRLFEFLNQFRIDINNLKQYLNGKDSLWAFLRGFFDSEGTVCYRTDTRGKNSYKYLFVGCYNNNLSYLNFVGDIVNKVGFNYGLSENRPHQYQLYVTGSQKVKKDFTGKLNTIKHHDQPELNISCADSEVEI